jgi:superfamily II DNA or RNA helicase
MKLRSYQKQGINDIYEAWRTDPILCFVLATGGGKNAVASEVIKRELLQGNRIMFLAHREELILQTWQTLYSRGIHAGIIMAGYPEKFDLPVQVCSIQTIIRRKELPPVDLIIIDEFQHCQLANTYGAIIKQYSHARILGLTATPIRLSGEGFKYVHPSRPTRLIVNRTLKQLQDEGWLVPLKYFAASIPDLNDVHLKKGDYVEEEARKAMELCPIVDSYLEHAKGRQGVTFTINIQHSIKTVQQYLHAGIPAEHLDGGTPDKERSRILSDFRAGLVKIISNVGIITEGFDFPDLQFVQLARPTKSLNLYLQMIGRCTRASPGIVDRFDTPEQRKRAIAASSKPYGLVLDNAGCWIDHGLPDIEHNWETHFEGTKKQKKPIEETMEMLVYIVEDSSGIRRRVFKAKEVEGMRLIEVTAMQRQKIIDSNAIREFNRLYAIHKNQRHVKKPGILAMTGFIDYCKKHNILITDDIWTEMYRRLVSETIDKTDQLRANRAGYPNSYPVQQFQTAIEAIEAQGVTSGHFHRVRGLYEQENRNDILKHRFSETVK